MCTHFTRSIEALQVPFRAETGQATSEKSSHLHGRCVCQPGGGKPAKRPSPARAQRRTSRCPGQDQPQHRTLCRNVGTRHRGDGFGPRNKRLRSSSEQPFLAAERAAFDVRLVLSLEGANAGRIKKGWSACGCPPQIQFPPLGRNREPVVTSPRCPCGQMSVFRWPSISNLAMIAASDVPPA